MNGIFAPAAPVLSSTRWLSADRCNRLNEYEALPGDLSDRSTLRCIRKNRYPAAHQRRCNKEDFSASIFQAVNNQTIYLFAVNRSALRCLSRRPAALPSELKDSIRPYSKLDDEHTIVPTTPTCLQLMVLR